MEESEFRSIPTATASTFRNLPTNGKFWLVGIPAFDAFTQGRTKREAPAMAGDLIETMADAKGFRTAVYPTGGESFEIGANRIGVLLAILLRRQRERHSLTLAQAAEKLGQRSKNAYARYEQGRSMPTVEKLEQLLDAIAPDRKTVWHIAA